MSGLKYARDVKVKHFNGVIPKIDTFIRSAAEKIDCSVTVIESCGKHNGRITWQCVLSKDRDRLKLAQFLYNLYRGCGISSISLSTSGRAGSTVYDVPISGALQLQSCILDVIRDEGMTADTFSLNMRRGYIIGGKAAILYGADSDEDTLICFEMDFQPDIPISFSKVTVYDFFAKEDF